MTEMLGNALTVSTFLREEMEMHFLPSVLSTGIHVRIHLVCNRMRQPVLCVAVNLRERKVQKALAARLFPIVKLICLRIEATQVNASTCLSTHLVYYLDDELSSKKTLFKGALV